MASKEDIEKISQWCEHIQKERKRIAAIEPNPFTREIKWTEKFSFIYINIPKERAPKNALVYESETHALWQYALREWVPVVQQLGTIHKKS